jgi:hypothetical protein
MELSSPRRGRLPRQSPEDRGARPEVLEGRRLLFAEGMQVTGEGVQCRASEPTSFGCCRQVASRQPVALYNLAVHEGQKMREPIKARRCASRRTSRPEQGKFPEAKGFFGRTRVPRGAKRR